MTENRARRKRVEVKFRLTPGLKHVKGDMYKLALAFVNIINNAFDAMQNSSIRILQIETRMSEDNTFVEVSFTDTGRGISERLGNEVDGYIAIFKPFVTDKPKGTGLGLAVTKRIVKEFHGEIKVASKKDVGTTFVIQLLPGEE